MVSENDTLPKLQINVIHVLRQRMLALRSQDVNNDLRFFEVGKVGSALSFVQKPQSPKNKIST